MNYALNKILKSLNKTEQWLILNLYPLGIWKSKLY